jgi:hypothetical protein
MIQKNSRIYFCLLGTILYIIYNVLQKDKLLSE